MRAYGHSIFPMANSKLSKKSKLESKYFDANDFDLKVEDDEESWVD